MLYLKSINVLLVISLARQRLPHLHSAQLFDNYKCSDMFSWKFEVAKWSIVKAITSRKEASVFEGVLLEYLIRVYFCSLPRASWYREPYVMCKRQKTRERQRDRFLARAALSRDDDNDDDDVTVQRAAPSGRGSPISEPRIYRYSLPRPIRNFNSRGHARDLAWRFFFFNALRTNHYFYRRFRKALLSEAESGTPYLQ